MNMTFAPSTRRGTGRQLPMLSSCFKTVVSSLAIVVCPGTGNIVNLEYLASLEDMSSVHDLAWDEHLLTRAMEEVVVFQERKRIQATIENPGEFGMNTCLPMLAIIYMDHLDIPVGLPNEHVIDYSELRIHFFLSKGF